MNLTDLVDSPQNQTLRSEILFGPFRLNPDAGHLFKGGRQIALGHRAVEILTLLVSRAGEVITHDEIVARAWPTSIVESNNLRVQISAIRKALGEESGAALQNIPGRGYRFNTAPERTENDKTVRAGSSAELATHLFGREKDADALLDMLTQSRCTTITGSGGMGKTALATHVCARLQSCYRDGVVFADFSGIRDDDEVIPVVLTALGIPLPRDARLAPLVDFLRNRHVLLVLDSSEHVIGGVSALVATLLAQTVYLTVLVTSREPLRIVGERVCRLAQLSCAPVSNAAISLQEVLAFPAAQMFCERTLANGGTFRPKNGDAFALALLCHRLDGIPLALELAAGRVQGLGLHGLVRQIDNYFGILTGGRRTASARQRTLQTTIEWSYRLLTDVEKRVLTHLSTFRWSFSLESAQIVAGGDGVTDEDIGFALSGLVEKSLVMAESGGHTTHFRLLRTTRAYASEKLCTDSAVHHVRRRYATAVLDLAEALTPQGLTDEAEQHQSYITLIDEVQQALTWALSDAGDQHLAAGLLLKSRYLWFHFSRLEAFIGLTEGVLLRLADDRSSESIRALLVSMGLAIYNVCGPVPRMREVLEKGLQFATEQSDLTTMRTALRGLWTYHNGLAEYAQSMHIAMQYGRMKPRDAEAVTMLATINGISLMQKGSLKRAFRYLEFAHIRSNPHFSQAADAYDYHQTVFESAIMARIAWLRGHFTMAFDLLDECLAAANVTERPTSMAFALAVAACPILLWSGKVDAAIPHIQTLQALAAAHAMQHWARYGELFAQSVAWIAAGDGASAAPVTIRSHWTPRHIEELSVLPGGMIPPAFLTRATSSSPIWCSAENIRVTAVREHALHSEGGTPKAIALLNKAIAIARSQDALTWELRASLSLATILREQAGRMQAYDVISPVLRQFDGSLATDDLASAHALLAQL